mgnify:CR=1 FL=1
MSMDEQAVRAALTRRLFRRSVAEGQVSIPAVPGLIDEYVSMCDTIFAAVGSKFSAEQLDDARTLIHGQLEDAYAASQRSSIVISYKAPVGTSLNYFVKPEWWTLEQTYHNWIATREPPLFGTHPDARVWALAGEAADPGTFRVLDIGAGTGRNALALARRGHPVDVVEVTAQFAETIRVDAQRESLDVRVIQRDVFSTTDDLRTDYQLILLSEVVPEFRTTEHVRSMFELATRCLAPGGRLVFNVFLAQPGYEPDDAARAMGEQMYTSIFTRDEMATATTQLPLELVADDSVHDYEQAHLPEGAWPPTGWYAGWVSGLDVYDTDRANCPIDMRWLVYRKTS